MPDGIVLFPNEQFGGPDPSWSRDGRWLTLRGGSLGSMREANTTLVVENVERHPHLRMVLPPADEASLSPDGATLALRTEDALRVVRVPSGEVVLDTHARGFRFWPDTSRLVVDESSAPEPSEHVVYDLGSGQRVARFGGSYAFRGASLVALGGREATQNLRDALPGSVIFARDPSDHFAFAPDGARWAYCKDEQSAVSIAEVASAQVLATSPLPFGCTDALAWTPDGNALALARSAAQVALLEGASGRLLSVHRGEDGENAQHIAFTPDGRWLCAAFGFRSECSWRRQGTELTPASPRNALVGRTVAVPIPMSRAARMAQGDPRFNGDQPIVALSDDEKLVAELEDLPADAGRSSMHLALYSAATRGLVRSVPLFVTNAEPDVWGYVLLRFGEDGRRVHVAVRAGTRFVDVQSGRVVAGSQGATLWSDPDSVLAERAIVDSASGVRREIAPERAAVTRLGAGAEVVARVSTGLRVQDWRTGSTSEIPDARGECALSTDGRWLAFRKESSLWVRDVHSQGGVFSRADASEGPLAVSAAHIATIGTDEVSRKGAVRLERLSGGNTAMMLAMSAYSTSVGAIAFDPAGATLVASEGATGCEAWDVATGKRLWHEERIALRAPPSFAGDVVLLGPRLLETRTGRPVVLLVGVEPEQVRAAALRQDGKLAALAFDDAVRVYDVESGRRLSCIPFRADAVAFDRASGHLVAGSGQLGIWDPATGARIRSLALDSAGVAAFDAQGRVELLGPDPSSLRQHLVCTVGPVVVPFTRCEEPVRRCN
jgi:hypothetical protein